MSATDSTDSTDSTYSTDDVGEEELPEAEKEAGEAAPTRRVPLLRGGYRPTGLTADQLPPPPASVTGSAAPRPDEEPPESPPAASDEGQPHGG